MGHACINYFFIIIVILTALFRPEALRGERPLHEHHAKLLASDIFIALDGSLRNLPELERIEAWINVSDIIKSNKNQDSTYSKFSENFSQKIIALAEIKNKMLRQNGPGAL
ncbi:hypothetical protein [Chromobacterium amazonense]|uniref:hypothetical protein n=1 Tax=Chromobacterium amazonense TaxID=1382803 RepID=UPI0011143F4B|nr:hypothetical protein [Chromobacterium amazonense]